MPNSKKKYHHAMTGLPMKPEVVNSGFDSEGEATDKLLSVQTVRMIDEFTDVNDGEKEIMKMWNLHVIKYKYVADCQIPLACHKFVEDQGKEIIEKNLYRNFVFHLVNLFDFGLLKPYDITNVIRAVHVQMKEAKTLVDLLRDLWISNTPANLKKEQDPQPLVAENNLPGPSGSRVTARASRRIPKKKNWCASDCCTF